MGVGEDHGVGSRSERISEKVAEFPSSVLISTPRRDCVRACRGTPSTCQTERALART